MPSRKPVPVMPSTSWHLLGSRAYSSPPSLTPTIGLSNSSSAMGLIAEISSRRFACIRESPFFLTRKILLIREDTWTSTIPRMPLQRSIFKVYPSTLYKPHSTDRTSNIHEPHKHRPQPRPAHLARKEPRPPRPSLRPGRNKLNGKTRPARREQYIR